MLVDLRPADAHQSNPGFERNLEQFNSVIAHVNGREHVRILQVVSTLNARRQCCYVNTLPVDTNYMYCARFPATITPYFVDLIRPPQDSIIIVQVADSTRAEAMFHFCHVPRSLVGSRQITTAVRPIIGYEVRFGRWQTGSNFSVAMFVEDGSSELPSDMDAVEEVD